MMGDAAKGHYWAAELPNGTWAVLRAAEENLYAEWHCIVALFPNDEARAKDYVRRENGAAETSALWDDVQTPAPASVSFNRRLEADLEDLFALCPEGITTRVLRDRYEVGYQTAVDALRYLGTIGKGQWVNYRGGDTRAKALFPPGAEIPSQTDLTPPQRKTFDAMCKLADKRGCVSVSRAEIANLAEIKFTSIAGALYGLERKGFIMMATPGDQTKPAMYQILKTEEVTE